MHPGLVAVTVSIVFTVLAGIILALRCISRFLIIRKGGIDDAFAILGYLASVAVTWDICIQYKHGLGNDVFKTSIPELILFARALWFGVIFYSLGMTFIGISALTQYLRFLFDSTYRIICYTMLAVIGGCGIAALFANIFSCRPIEYWWNRLLPNGKCIDLIAWWLFGCAFIAVVDVILVLIPVFAIKDLNMPRAQKKALIFVFVLGGFDCVIAILRFRSLYVTATGINITMTSVEVASWSSIEMNVGVICVSLPSLKALYVTVRTYVGERTKASSSVETIHAYPKHVELTPLEQSIQSTATTL